MNDSGSHRKSWKAWLLRGKLEITVACYLQDPIPDEINWIDARLTPAVYQNILIDPIPNRTKETEKSFLFQIV